MHVASQHNDTYSEAHDVQNIKQLVATATLVAYPYAAQPQLAHATAHSCPSCTSARRPLPVANTGHVIGVMQTVAGSVLFVLLHDSIQGVQ